jgi:peptidoglycan/xylan/chitin deacetylase (PgdA/CDA1 family)
MKAQARIGFADGSSQRGPRRLAVLGFHKVGSPPDGCESWFYIPSARFVDYLRWLKDSDWCVISAPQFLTSLEAPDTLPPRSVLLTFDDGYRSMRDVTLPLLHAFNFPAVLFVPTEYIGHVNRFDAGVEPEEAICDWADLMELQRDGVSIQSHSVSHRPFSMLDRTERDRELKESRALLEERLGRPVELFSFPYGDAGGDRSASASALQRAGYRAAYLYGGGPVAVPIADVYQIPRLKMGPDTDLGRALEDAPMLL